MRIAIVTASNSDEILSRNLLRSPLLQSLSVELHVERDPPSAAAAYNRGLDATTAEIVVFAHHDVFLPAGWDALLAERIAEVERQDPEWGLIGAFGIGLDEQEYGPVWSSSIGRIIGRVSLEPVPAQSYDELLIVMRRGAGLRFDEAMPWFHFYGTDIVQPAGGPAARPGSRPCRSSITTGRTGNWGRTTAKPITRCGGNGARSCRCAPRP